MRWRKFYEDVVGIFLLPFIAAAKLAAFLLFLGFGWVPVLFGVPLVRYSSSEFWQGVGSSLLAVSWLWLLIVVFEFDVEEVKKL